MSTNVKQLKGIRKGHRGVATRRIAEIETALADPVLDRIKLAQLKLGIQETFETLKQLERDLAPLIPEAEMVTEIDRNEETKDKIFSALAKIEAALTVSTTATGSAALTARTAPVTMAKLPKLSIKSFYGNLKGWSPFWDAYNAAIHSNTSLSNVEKFAYLQSFLEGKAKEAIAGLAVTDANYGEAIAILKHRFGNKDQIVAAHMNALMNLDSVTSDHHTRDLRRLYDTAEANIRGLDALGVTLDSYGVLLIPAFIRKIPPELRLTITRKVPPDEWELLKILEVLREEIEARERAILTDTNSKGKPSSNAKGQLSRALLSVNADKQSCCYCGAEGHSASQCKKYSNTEDRKKLIRESGRCFNCLRKGHTSSRCHSTSKCKHCGGKHHTSICARISTNGADNMSQVRANPSELNPTRALDPKVDTFKPSLTCFTGDSDTVLLQMATVRAFNLEQPSIKSALLVLMDSGSQSSYITERACQALNLKKLGTKPLSIMTFGSKKERHEKCNIVKLGLETENDSIIELRLLSVEHICEPIISSIVDFKWYPHLRNLPFAFDYNSGTMLEPDILLGSDQYWNLLTGEIIKSKGGPTALNTHLGWILSGPVLGASYQSNQATLVTHVLGVTHAYADKSLDKSLKSFWDTESIGIVDKEDAVQIQFEQHVAFNNGRYTVSLPWKEYCLPLPSNYELCESRLNKLLKRLRKEPELLRHYDSIIQEQLALGIIVPASVNETRTSAKLHYLPHHAVVRHDKDTTKIRIVYDASAKTSGPSLNDCLHVGPSLNQKIYDILLRFRLHKIAVIADIEKAFLMIQIAEEDQDVLRFLWIDSIHSTNPSIVEFKFTRVVFGVTPSPYLLNATIAEHLRRYVGTHQNTVKKIKESIYVDDIVTGVSSVEEAMTFYKESKHLLKLGGFNLRKFMSNNSEVQYLIDQEEQTSLVSNHEESYAQRTLGGSITTGKGESKVLGVVWDSTSDEIIVDIEHIVAEAHTFIPTKRNVVSIVSKVYDPIGLISPVVIPLKIFFQSLCEAKVEWDDPLSRELDAKWKMLLHGIHSEEPLRFARRFNLNNISSCMLLGFCDASQDAYAAVTYLSDGDGNCSLVSSKTRVAPLPKQTIPRLELLGAVLLARLVNRVKEVLGSVVNGCLCFTDSLVVLHWIKGLDKNWKPYVQNRVLEIRRRVPVECWRHCSGEINPADIPSRGTTIKELHQSELWFYGPGWASLSLSNSTFDSGVPPECLIELRVKDKLALAMSVVEKGGIGNIMDINRFSSYERLIRSTACMLSFLNKLKQRLKNSESTEQLYDDQPYESTLFSKENIIEAEVLWIQEVQRGQITDGWKSQFQLFLDNRGVWRCGGRLGNADLPYHTRHPVLLPRTHQFTLLVIRRAHLRVSHSGVKDTLTEVRHQYWVPGVRSLVRRFIHQCVTCRRYSASCYRPPPPPPLPDYRVQSGLAFTSVGVDYAGPLVIKHHAYTSDSHHALTPNRGGVSQNAFTSSMGKAWICLFTCCTSRAVHLDIVTDLTPESFIRCLKRFISRRGLPTRIVSDNGSTFTASNKIVQNIFNSPGVQRYLEGRRIMWNFNLQRAPWWGGFFERMVQLQKRCLKKMIGRAKLNYEELLTELAEVELILNSRPLTYISALDIDEPLTPSHLVCGRRLLSLPDHLCYPDPTDEDYDPNPVITFTRRSKYLNSLLEQFWSRWREEYLLELRESHRQGAGKNPDTVSVGDVVIIHDDSPRGLWRLGVIEETLKGRDNKVRGAVVRVNSGSQASSFLRRPIQRLYPLEVRATITTNNQIIDQHSGSVSNTERIVNENLDTSQPTAVSNVDTNDESGDRSIINNSNNEDTTSTICTRAKRKAAAVARDSIVARLIDSSI